MANVNILNIIINIKKYYLIIVRLGRWKNPLIRYADIPAKDTQDAVV